MISLSGDFDLGRDQTRIKDRRDGERQRRTASELLQRLYGAGACEMQIVADEVGMGKTFVALGVAYSVLQAMHHPNVPADLGGCARRVLIIAPQGTLAHKWQREVGEFLRRCVHDEAREGAHDWFRAVAVTRLDDLARVLRAPDGPGIVITQMSVLASGKKFLDLDLKRRLVLGALFRSWGNRFSKDGRERLLRGAPEGWPRDPDQVLSFTPEELARLPFAGVAEVRQALDTLATAPATTDKLEKLLATCKEIAAPYVRERDELFRDVMAALGDLYRDVCFASVEQALPLVVVDEAHNWRNGPRAGAHGYGGFERHIAPLTRRAVLLTATPFQLRPEEMLELLRVNSVIAASPVAAETEARRAAADAHRRDVLAPVLQTAAQQSRCFAAAWARLPAGATGGLAATWGSASLARVRASLRAAAHESGRVDPKVVAALADAAVVEHPPELRDILREGLRLYAYNEDLSQELGAYVIRHRRRTDHRLVRVGCEYADEANGARARADRSTLHAAPGIDVRGDAELPHYLLMRCVSEMKAGKGRSALGTALTGCYSTLLQSAEGKAIQRKLSDGVGRTYLDLLLGMVGEQSDPDHPKVRVLVDAVLANWHRGEKTLIFCFRTHTARRLQQILDARIQAELDGRREAVLGGAEHLVRLRSRFTRRDGELVGLGLDRVLWSLRWAARSEDVPLPELALEDLRLEDGELDDLATLALRYGVDLADTKLDRVFLHRATEHVLAQRILRGAGKSGLLRRLLEAVADESWVRAPLGVEHSSGDGDAESGHADAAGLDDRGVHATYTAGTEPTGEAVRQLADELRDRRERARRQGQTSVLDAYATAPSFWLGSDPEAWFQRGSTEPVARSIVAFHTHLLAVMRSTSGVDWQQRLLAVHALRRAVMRESVLVRILPERSERDDAGWGVLLVERYFTPLPGQRESMADRSAVFLEDLQAAGGAVHEEGSARHAMVEATRMRDTAFVVLVDGQTAADRRERVFAGFNSPLLPEVLVCTSVGQEGIDLHRHCRHVVHYDLAWNPAVLEQRTGRVDRIGSKTFREQAAGDEERRDHALLDVGVPFLAGTYDERMYEEIRIRAQTFEVLTGGDVTTDNLEGNDDADGCEGVEAGLRYPLLPPEMVADLRVRLHVWAAETP